MAKAKLITGASDGPIRAAILDDVSLNGEIVLVAGTLLLGSGASTEERLYVNFNRLVKKDGTSEPVRAQAFDGKDKIAGLKGNKISSEATKLAAGIGLNFLGGMSEALQESEVQGGVAVRKPSLKNALLNGAATATLDQGRDIISSIKNKAPLIEVPAGRIVLVGFE